MEFDKKTRKTVIGFVFICIIFFLAVKNIGTVTGVMGKAISIFTPFIVGAGLAFLINVPMNKIEAKLFPPGLEDNKTAKKAKIIKGARRPVSFFLTLILGLGVLGIAINIIVPQIADTMVAVGKQIPFAIDTSQKWINDHLSTLEAVKKFTDKANVDWDKIASNLSSALQAGGSNLLNSGFDTVSGILSGLVSFFIGLIFAIYLLMQKEKLACQGKQVLYSSLAEKTADRVIYVLSMAGDTFAKFITGQCLEACILALMFFISMTVIGLPYALMISVMIGFLNLIPILGSFIGLFFGGLLMLMESPSEALIFLILFIVLQQIEANLIYPHVVGNSVGLPSIWVLMAVTVGGSLMGVLGMILFIPLCSVLYFLITFYVKDSLDRKDVNAKKWLEPVDLSPEVLRRQKRTIFDGDYHPYK